MRSKKTIILLLTTAFFILGVNKANSQIVVLKKPTKPSIVFAKKSKPGTNYLWVEPHWQWNGKSNRYIWVQGHWVKNKRNFTYIQGHWAATKKGYKWVPGHWKRKR